MEDTYDKFIKVNTVKCTLKMKLEYFFDAGKREEKLKGIINKTKESGGVM
jgi:hypothetical protein